MTAVEPSEAMSLSASSVPVLRLLEHAARAPRPLDQAVTELRLAIEQDPSCADNWNSLGVALYGLGKLWEAHAAFARAVAVEPGHAAAATNRDELLVLLRTGPLRGTHRVAAVCCIYDDLRWIREVVDGAYSECDTIYFLVNEHPWTGPPRDISETFRRIAALDDPDKKVIVVRGSWSAEGIQRNYGLELLERAGFDYCLVLDGDEVYDPVQLRRLTGLAASAPSVECWDVELVTYWKSPAFRIDPPEPLRPAILVKLGSTARFSHMRHVESRSRARIDPRVCVCHHLSYARSDAELRRKLASFSHAHEVAPEWYERVWLAWDKDHDLPDLHPTHPGCFRRAVQQPPERLPPALRHLDGADDRQAFAIATVCGPALGACYQEIIETLVHGLRELGHDALVLEGNTFANDRCNIVLGAQDLRHVPGAVPPPGSILYNFEQAESDVMRHLPETLRPYEVWDYSSSNVAFLRAHGIEARLVAVGYAPQLTRIVLATRQDIDVLFYGQINARRARVLDELRRRNLEVVGVCGRYGADRDELVARSKVVLNMHYYEPGIFEIVRVSYLLANRVCVVSELGTGAEAMREGVALAAYEDLPELCVAMVRDPARRRAVAERGFAIMQSQPEREILEQVIKDRQRDARRARHGA